MNDSFDPSAQAPQPNLPPAGFYPDNNGAQRYWDGSAWTQHIQTPAPAPAPAAAAGRHQTTGAEPRPWFKKKRIVIPLGAVALLVIGGIAGGGTEPTAESDVTTAVAADAESSDESAKKSVEPAEAEKPKEEAKPKAKPKPKAEVVKVGAAEMLSDYDGNELAADKKYEGKRIQVTGTVDKIDTEFFDNDQYVLRISDGSEFSFLTVNCNDMSSDELSTLTVGNEVTAIGKFDDGGDLGVELKKCTLA